MIDLADENKYVTATYIDARPAALIQGRMVEWGELRPLLNEVAGATVLQEVMLERVLKSALADARTIGGGSGWNYYDGVNGGTGNAVFYANTNTIGENSF